LSRRTTEVPEEALAALEGSYIRVPSSPLMNAWTLTIPGRYHRKGDDCWLLPAAPHRVIDLQKMGVRIHPELLAWANRELAPPPEVHISEIVGLVGVPMEFQWEGIEFTESRHCRALIGDEQGLGKTIEALAWMTYHNDAFPAIIICPNSVKINWRREASRWIHGRNIQIVEGTRQSDIPKGDLLIVNFEIIERRLQDLLNWGPRTMVVDECHRIKNPSAKSSKAAVSLSERCHHVIGMSGTPVVNRPSEFFNVLKMIRPSLFPSYWEYVQRYCGAVYENGGLNFNGASHTQELHERLTQTVMIRRLKKDVLPQLPSKVRSIVPLPISNRAEYTRAKTDFIAWLEKADPEKADKAAKAIALTRIESLKQLTTSGKIKMAIDWVEDFIEGEKIIVFCTHVNLAIRVLTEHFGSACVNIDGTISKVERQAASDRFNRDPDCRLLVGQLKSAGVGLNLQMDCANVAFLELGWTPGDHDQAEDRIHRIGQTRQCGIYYLVAENTVEEDIMDILDTKRQVLHQVLDGGEASEEGMLQAILKKLRASMK